MNFQFMPELHSPYGYPAVMALILGVCGFLYWRFKRTRWL
jgi:magnesium transporter